MRCGRTCFLTSSPSTLCTAATHDRGNNDIVEDDIFVMLLVEKFFQTFTAKAICNAAKSTEVLVCLSCDSPAQVDEMVAKAVAAGGSAPRNSGDHGFMYQHGFEDPDGHIWELVCMEPGG